GDIIHLRRPDGRDIDYWLNVNPDGEEKGMFVAFNPLNENIKKTVKIPLYYTGLTDKVMVIFDDEKEMELSIDRDYNFELEVTVKANQFTWITFR
nr:alpha-galactosidase [Flammeovirgaceae bacterium]